jgi:hypothetical protein
MEMKKLTFDEYKVIHKKLTKNQVAYYETNFGYRTKIRDEETLNEIACLKRDIEIWREKMLQKIKAEKILNKERK